MEIKIQERALSDSEYYASKLNRAGLAAALQSLTRTGRESAENLNNSQVKSENRVIKQASAYAFDPDIDDAEYVLLPKLDVKLAAGYGAAATDEKPVGMLAFRRDWLQKHPIQPGLVSAVEVSGDSMVPYLNEGDTVLIDHTRNQLWRGRVVATRVGNDLFVKRLQKMEDSWILISDNHDYAPLGLGADDAVIGEVVWCGRWVS